MIATLGLLVSLLSAVFCTAYKPHSCDSYNGTMFVCSEHWSAQNGWKCRDLYKIVKHPGAICTLDVSSAALTSIPKGVLRNYTNLVNLFLSNNKINHIYKKSFEGLQNLRVLNLSHNNVQTWDTTDLHNQVPNLEYLDMTGNQPTWSPNDNILQLKNLKEIRGVSWNKCTDCQLTRNTNSTELKNIQKGQDLVWVSGYACRANVLTYSETLKYFAKYGFYASCLQEGSKCYVTEVHIKSNAPCRDVNIRVLTLEYVFGPIAIILNLVVVLTTAFSRRLRRNVAMVLVTNLALGDFLNGIYSVAVTAVHHVYNYEETRKFADTKCDFIGPLWAIGQAMSVSCSLVLTYERYRSVVNSVKVKSRLKMKTARISLCVCWLWSILVAILPLVGVGMYSVGTFCIPIYPVRSVPLQFWYSVAVTLSAAIMYLVTIPLYIRLYLYVRKSSNRIGSKTDVALAKRIFLLVMSNMFFFLLPIAISLAWSILSRKQVMSRVAAEVLTSSFCVICLTVNSCLNPVLYALRNRTFIKELRKMLYLRIGRFCGLCNGDNRTVSERTSNSASKASTHHLQKYTI